LLQSRNIGIENFEKEILLEAESSEEMFSKERELVELGPHSYNLKEGGEGGWSQVNLKKLNCHFGDSNPLRNPEIRFKVSETLRGKPKSIEHRNKIASSLKGTKREKCQHKVKRIYIEGSRKSYEVQCPYCGKTGGNTAMGRWHFDNCRNKM
jgi:uncharacterized Zn-finger protein